MVGESQGLLDFYATDRMVLKAFCLWAVCACIHDRILKCSLVTWYLINCMWKFHQLYFGAAEDKDEQLHVEVKIKIKITERPYVVK